MATALVAVALLAGCKVEATGMGGAGADGKPPGRPAAPAPHTSPGPSGTDRAAPGGLSAPAKPTAPAAPLVLKPGQQGVKVRELQARLRQIDWFTLYPTGHYGDRTAAAVKGFQTKRGLPGTGATDTVTWQRLLGMTREPSRAELYATAAKPPAKPAAKPDPRCLTGRVLCISKKTRSLSWVVDGRVRSTMDVRFGSQYTPTREGVFKVYWKSRHHVSTLYDTPMPYAMFFSGGQAVHYSADFAARGYAGASHGCVNVRDKQKIASLFAQVRNGDKVVVHQ